MLLLYWPKRSSSSPIKNSLLWIQKNNNEMYSRDIVIKKFSYLHQPLLLCYIGIFPSTVYVRIVFGGSYADADHHKEEPEAISVQGSINLMETVIAKFVEIQDTEKCSHKKCYGLVERGIENHVIRL